MNFIIDPLDLISVEAINKNTLDKLNEILRNTESVKGISAYWTLKYIHDNYNTYSEYCKNIYHLLKKDESYMCADLHTPTNIECITNAVNDGCNFYMFLLEGKGDIYSALHNRLLHSKLVVFEGKNFDYILVGSHNQTGQALNDINEEFSLLLKINPQSNTKENIIEYLEFIRSLCYKLPAGKIEKWMLELVQKRGELKGIQNMNYIECTVLKETTFNSIKTGTLIHLISFSKIDDDQLSKINDNFCLSVQTKDGSYQKFLLVKVDKSSMVDDKIKKDSTGQSFEKRHYLYHGLTKDHARVTPSVIFPKKKLDSNYFSENKFNLELQVMHEIQTIRKSTETSIYVETWVDYNKSEKNIDRFLSQHSSLSGSNETKNTFYNSIRIIDQELLKSILDSEDEIQFKKSYQKYVIEELGDPISTYFVSDEYIDLFKRLDTFVAQNRPKRGKQTNQKVLKEFERLFKDFKNSNEILLDKNTGKLKKINSKHKFINRGVGIINQ